MEEICFYSDSKLAIDYIKDNQQVVPYEIYALLTKIREAIGAL